MSDTGGRSVTDPAGETRPCEWEDDYPDLGPGLCSTHGHPMGFGDPTCMPVDRWPRIVVFCGPVAGDGA